MPQGALLQRLRVGRAVSGHFRTNVSLMIMAYSAIVRTIEIAVAISNPTGVSAKIIGMLPRTNAHTIAEEKLSTRSPTPQFGQGNSTRFASNIETLDRQDGQRGLTGSYDH